MKKFYVEYTKTKQKVLISPYTNQWSTHAIEHTHDFYEFTIPISGYATNIYNGIQHPLVLGQIILMRPGDIHEIKEDNSNNKLKHVHRDVYVEPEKMKTICSKFSSDLFESIMSGSEPLCFKTEATKITLLEKQLNLFSQKQSDFIDYESLHTCIVYEILAFYLEYKLNNNSPYPNWLQQFILQLYEIENMSKKVSELNSLVNYSHGYLCREFKKFTGKTLESYLTEIRINHSFSMLLHSNLSIAQIANILGYDSQNSFTRNFKKQTGKNPLEWRKEFCNVIV